MGSYRIMIRGTARGGPHEGARSLSRLQLLKWSLAALLALSVGIAFFLAAFVIGLILAIPLIVMGLVWLASMAWRGKIRIRRHLS